MALDISPEQKALGKANFQRASDELSRRGFLKVLLAGGAVVPVGAAAYFGYRYEQLHNKPVRAGLIGAGDEGGVLVGDHNPKFLEFVAVADIRPYNQKRIYKGDPPPSGRKGLNHHYGSDAEKRIRLYEDYREMLKDPNIEAVVIALPLHLHARASIDAMRAGKHVLCEKLMAWNIDQCKEMIRTSEETGTILSIGHQRHYSLLYAQAAMAVQAGVLGDLKHIRALWHRNNSWPELNDKGVPTGALRDGWRPKFRDEDKKALPDDELRSRWDYKDLNELVRWRLYGRTGGGLMAELGSHQLDACSIFLTANAKRNYPKAGDDFKLMPLAVSGVGGKFFYKDDREVEDSVFVSFEFPGPTYYAALDGRPTTKVANKDDIVVVTYSSMNTNAFESYGECLMGSRGTMIVDSEQTVMLYGERDPNLRDAGAPRSTAVTVTSAGGGPVIDTTATSGPQLATGPTPVGDAGGPVSRGYREEMEHFAYCVRMQQEEKSEEGKRKWQKEVRCHGRVAMADAIMALTSNLAMRRRQRIAFKPEWFDPASPELPDADMKAVDHAGKMIRL